MPSFASSARSYVCVIRTCSHTPSPRRQGVTPTYVSSYYYICSHTAIYVLILLYVCPHTTICVLILYSPHTTIHVCPHTTMYVSSYYYMCPHTTIYMSSYYDIHVLIPLDYWFGGDRWCAYICICAYIRPVVRLYMHMRVCM
jgi:hypothetical protein